MVHATVVLQGCSRDTRRQRVRRPTTGMHVLTRSTMSGDLSMEWYVLGFYILKQALGEILSHAP